MVKAKQRKQELAVQSESRDPGDGSEMDPYDDCSWVVVKKQRVTILLPPLPIVEQASAPKPHPKPLEGSIRTTIGKEYQQPEELTPRSGIHPVGFNLVASPRSQSQPPDHIAAENRKLLEMGKSPRGFEQMSGFNCPFSFPNGCSLMKQRLRARNLERKLKRAGGLKEWLVSLGLEQFVRIFERRSVNKFQLASITMNKLKDMGAMAVGPRRKLMHAIDCCCGP